jgi:hypothetical protein
MKAHPHSITPVIPLKSETIQTRERPVAGDQLAAMMFGDAKNDKPLLTRTSQFTKSPPSLAGIP